MLRRFLLRASAARRRLPNAHFPPPCSAPLVPNRSVSSTSYYSSSSSQIPDSPFAEQLEDNLDQTATQPTTSIAVDRSGLYNPPEHSHEPTSDSELVKHLKGIIKFRGGPISVAEYMEEVLTNPKARFYMNRDVFGAGGDFITSPEVSQMFGEMVGVWAMSLWEQMRQPDKVNLVELGPGRGTLMADLLQCSPALQKLQYQKLECANKEVSDGKRTVSALAKTPVSWHATLEDVPTGLPSIIIAHEFYDALPVHQFQKAARGGSEKMIDVAEDSTFRFVLSSQPTPATLYLAKRCKWAGNEEIAKLQHIEVCPKAMESTQTIAERIASDGGGALIIDYGLNGVVSDSLQAIRKHKFVNILDDPASADLSAYVDFASIRHSAEEISGEISVHGPITQSRFLGSLGINFRAEALTQNCTEEQFESLRNGYWQLVGEGESTFWEGPDEKAPIGMGTRYLAMAIVNKKQGRERARERERERMGSYLSRYIDNSAGEESGVTSFHSSERWQLHLNAHKESSQLLVVDFSASWCGPCRFIEPAIRAMAAKFTDVQFAKIDVNELSEVAQAFGVEAMPTFVLLKKGKEVDRVIGAQKDELEKKTPRHGHSETRTVYACWIVSMCRFFSLTTDSTALSGCATPSAGINIHNYVISYNLVM
ncbi:NADH dehydrogenase complex I assembly factor 7-like [Pyrus ussuriensis x Pyrus communis]|uniref:type II protein arginine methyltransferase n=1 Tax=Pyrus ussuriensis x Pyrus communis TaxID=2448454 RepID=A0A5N5GEK7_9ROSA|nr:NADH dehydrogenase complex I assembly factor 7-like [Pyrus ussuriensis x Pyrus communis]